MITLVSHVEPNIGFRLVSDRLISGIPAEFLDFGVGHFVWSRLAEARFEESD